jgi:histone H3/H4
MQERSREIDRITPQAFAALQEATETYVVNLLEDSYRATLNRGQVTLQVKDIELVRLLRREY